MYEPIPQQGPCCSCAPNRSKGAHSSECCNWEVDCGCVLLIIGVIAILMGFMVPQNPKANPRWWNDLHQINLFVDIFVIPGLSVSSIGGNWKSGWLVIRLICYFAVKRNYFVLEYTSNNLFRLFTVGGLLVSNDKFTPGVSSRIK